MSDTSGKWTQQTLIEYLTEIRYLREVRGIVVAGVAVSTERGNDRTVWQQLHGMAAGNAGFTTRVKTSAGFVFLNAAKIIHCVTAGIAYIAGCFAVEYQITQLILDATTAEDFDAIEGMINNADTWPNRVIE